MANDYFNATGVPPTNSTGSSAQMRSEFANVAGGFEKLPPLSGYSYRFPVVNALGTALTYSALYASAADNIGVGTASPATKLHVESSGATRIRIAGGVAGAGLEFNDANTRIVTPTANALAFYTGNTERARLDDNGSLGLGTTTPQGQVHIGGASSRGLHLTGPSAAAYIVLGNQDSGGAPGPAVIASSNRALQFGVGDSFTSVTGGAFSEFARLDNTGNFGINTTAPTGKLDVNDTQVRVRQPRTPGSATATGNQGEVCWDSSYVYVCIANNTWRRAALSAW